MLIKVTEKHIQTGTRMSVASCPLALAIREQAGEQWYASQAVVWRGDIIGSIKLPDEVAARLRNYDHGGSMSPFEVELPLEQLTAVDDNKVKTEEPENANKGDS